MLKGSYPGSYTATRFTFLVLGITQSRTAIDLRGSNRGEARGRKRNHTKTMVYENEMRLTANLRREWIKAGSKQGSGIGGCSKEAPGSRSAEVDHASISLSSPSSSSPSFCLMNYNILADCHIQEGWYPYCPENSRAMRDRHVKVMAEIDHHAPDIVCLQEVGADYFVQQLSAHMYLQGYEGVFMKKVLQVEEGVATFYKRDRFEMLEQSGISFNQLVAKECSKAGLARDVTESVLAHTNASHALLLTKLLDIKTKMCISLANSHLLYGEFKDTDVITLQAGLSINALVKFAGGADQPHIFCGDFNQEPNMVGYQLMHDGILSRDSEQFLRKHPIDGGGKGACASLLDVLPHCFQHQSSSLQSAYKAVTGHEVPFSSMEDCRVRWPSSGGIQLRAPNFSDPPPGAPRKAYFSDITKLDTEPYISALDYQWFGSQSLRCTATLEMVYESEIIPYHACPNEAFPSDHMAIVSRFEFIH